MPRLCWSACAVLAGILMATTSSNAQQVTAGDVVAACAEAMGGSVAIDSIRTIRLAYQLPDHGGQAHLEIKRPNKLRVGNLVFDGQRAAILARPPAADGTLRPAELVPVEEWKDFEMEVGWFFPAFFDFPAEYGGIEVVDGIETHKLEVILPLGASLTYFIDTATNLPLMLESRVTVHGRDSRYIRRFGDYRENGGILYPHTYTYFSHFERQMYTVQIRDLELNVPLDDSRFAVPAELRVRQDASRSSTGPYLGRVPPGNTPQIFAPGVIFTEMHEVDAAFTPDGKELYLAVMADIGTDYVAATALTRLENGVWSDLEKAPFSDVGINMDPFVKPDGSKLFFTATRPLDGELTTTGDFLVRFVYR